MRGKFVVVLAEAIDRLSRDQEDIAGLLQCVGDSEKSNKNNQPPKAQCAAFYLAILIGCVWQYFVIIVVPPSVYDDKRLYSLRYDSAFERRVPMRRAIFRALRRCGSAAWLQRSDRRGALFHRTDGASSQAIERGPAGCSSARQQAR